MPIDWTENGRVPYERVKPKNVARVLKRHLPHRVDVPSTSRYRWPGHPDVSYPLSCTMGHSWIEAIEWCHAQFGPSKIIGSSQFKGRGYVNVCALPRTWANGYSHFFFRSPEDAFWFKMRWYERKAA